MISRIVRLLASFAAPVAITIICDGLLKVNATTVAMFYLIAVLLIAAFWGLAESIIAALVAVLCFNFFFLPPVLTFTIADVQNWIALFALLATALIGSQLSSYARKQTRIAWNSKRETEQLYSLSRTILLLDEETSAASQIARHIVRVFEFSGASIFDRYSSAIHSGKAELSASLADRMKEVANNGNVIKDEKQKLSIAPIRLGSEPIGSLATEGLFLSDGAQQAVLNLIAITLERERHREEATQARAERKSERFKSTLLDGIAHEFKTPLTSIKAAATSLLSHSRLSAPAGGDLTAVRELVTVIDEETDRLTGLVNDAIQMARIEAGALTLRKRRCNIDELVGRAVHHLDRRRDGRSFDVQLSNDLPVLADPDLLSLTIRLLLDNALKYSPPLSSITISAVRQNGNVIVRVHDEGAAIPVMERERLFEKFYRGPGDRNQVPGTGMGLAIARDIARAHGGDIQIEGENNEGTTFVLMIRAETGTSEDGNATDTRS